MTDRINSVTTPGGSIGARLARLVSDSIIHTRAATGPTVARVGQQIFTDATNHVSDEVRGVMGGIFRQVATAETTTPELKALFTALGTQRGQAWAWIGGTATGAAMGGGLMNLLTNELNAVILPIIASNPHGVLSPSDAARARSRGITAPPEWNDEARKGGIDQNRFNALVTMNHTYPSLAEILDMLNRGAIGRDTAIGLMHLNGYRDSEIGDLLALREFVLSPQDLAAMWNRDIVSDSEGAKLAARSGVNAEDFRRMTLLGGEPPDLTSIILAWRRGIITEADVDRAIVQGPIRKEWIPVVKGLQEEPLSPQEAAAAVTQGHLTPAQGQAKAALSGINAEDFKTIVANSGRPPGIDFASEAFNRHLIDDATWTRMFLESAIKNEYIPVMKAMRTNPIPAETVRMMYRLGVYPRDAAVSTLMGHGFTQVDADAMIALEDVRKTEGTKDLSSTQVINLYVDELVSRETAAEMLRSVGYDDQETEWRIAMAEVDKMRRYVNAVISKVRAAYVNSRIPVNEAVSLLDQAGVSARQRDALIDLWDLERDTVSATLTTAQIQAALRKGYLTSAAAYERLLGRGYAPADAGILVRLAGGDAPIDSGSEA